MYVVRNILCIHLILKQPFSCGESRPSPPNPPFSFSFRLGILGPEYPEKDTLTTITLEDVVNNFLLPVFGDESPFDINLSGEDLVVEDKLFGHFGGHAASSGGKPARMGRWVMTLSREKDKEVRWAGFLAFLA